MARTSAVQALARRYHHGHLLPDFLWFSGATRGNLRYFHSSARLCPQDFDPVDGADRNEGSFEQRHIETIAEACR